MKVCAYSYVRITSSNNLQASEREFDPLRLPPGSVGLLKNRAKEVYDGNETDLRMQLTSNNTYNLILRHQPFRGWYRKYSNDVMRGNGKGICEKCK